MAVFIYERLGLFASSEQLDGLDGFALRIDVQLKNSGFGFVGHNIVCAGIRFTQSLGGFSSGLA
ncbi:hypothetical protein D3C71_2151280 [compost metagenome]